MHLITSIVMCFLTACATAQTAQEKSTGRQSPNPYEFRLPELLTNSFSEDDFDNYLIFEGNECSTTFSHIICKREISKKNPTTLKIKGFDDIILPVTEGELRNKKFTLRIKLDENKTMDLSSSIEEIGQKLCFSLPSIKNKFCTEKEISVEEVITSQDKPQKVSFIEQYYRELGNRHKLIVISLSDGFKESGKNSVIYESLKKLLYALHSEPSKLGEQEFTLLTIGSGRELQRVLDSNELPDLPKENTTDNKKDSVLLRLDTYLLSSFAASDLRSMDDLELVDSLMQDDKTLEGEILYLTNDDGFEIQERPRNQCIPLAWNHANIKLRVLTTKKCEVWQEHAGFTSPEQCLEWEAAVKNDNKKLIKIFKDFLQIKD